MLEYDPNRNKEKKGRNKKIVVKVLNGETLDNVVLKSCSVAFRLSGWSKYFRIPNRNVCSDETGR